MCCGGGGGGGGRQLQSKHRFMCNRLTAATQPEAIFLNSLGLHSLATMRLRVWNTDNQLHKAACVRNTAVSATPVGMCLEHSYISYTIQRNTVISATKIHRNTATCITATQYGMCLEHSCISYTQFSLCSEHSHNSYTVQPVFGFGTQLFQLHSSACNWNTL